MIVKIAGIGIIAAFCASMLSEMGCKNKKLFAALSVIIMLLGLVGELAAIFGELYLFGEQSGISELTECALKIVGIGYVFGIGSEVASELGEKGIADMLTLLCRIEMLIIVFPYIRELILLGVKLVK